MYVLDDSWSLGGIDCPSDLVHSQHIPNKHTKNGRQIPIIRMPEAEPTTMPMVLPMLSVDPELWAFTKAVHMKTAATMRRGEKT